MSLLLTMFLLSCTAGFFDSIGYKRGIEEGFRNGQVEAMHGKWHYATRIITTTNMVYTNYVKFANGVPEPLNIDISPVQYKFEMPNFFLFTNSLPCSNVSNVVTNKEMNNEQ